jgi:hypothetical protein
VLNGWINATRPFRTKNETLGMGVEAPATGKRLDKSKDLRNQAFQAVMTELGCGGMRLKWMLLFS